jgi:hypothetical protein
MKKFLIYSSALIVLCAACVEAFATPVDETDSSIPAVVTSAVVTSVATNDTLPVSAITPSSSTTPVTRKPSATPSAIDDIDCDEAEELYDAGNNDDLADYCDYGPDGEWDTEDDYDSWEE